MANNSLNITAGLKLKMDEKEISKQLGTIKTQIENKLDVSVNLKIRGVDELKKAMKPAQSEADKLASEINKAYGRAIEADKKFNDQKVANAEKLKTQTLQAVEKMAQEQLKIEQNLANQISDARQKAISKRNAMDRQSYTESLKLKQAQSAAEDKWYGQIKNFTPKSNTNTNNITSVQPINQATLAMNNYEKAIARIIQKYKMKQTADEDFIKTANRIMENSKFQSLSDQKQIQVLQQLTSAEKKYDQALKARGDLQARQATLNSTVAPQSSVKIYDQLKQQEVQQSMRTQVSGLQTRINTASRSGSGIIDPTVLASVNSQYAQLEARIGRITNNRMAQQWSTDYQRLTTQVRGFNETIEASNRGIGGYINNVGSLIKKFSDWMVVGTIFMQTINAIKGTIAYVAQMDEAMVSLGKVTDLSTSQMEGLRQSAIETGKALGKSSIEIMNSYAEIARIYKDPADIRAMSDVAVMASNVTSLTAQEAAKSLNTTLLTFKLGVKDAAGVLDQYNEIQNNYRKMCAV